jgi:hypothetical protein
MGLIHDRQGKISIEENTSTFVVHAAYGWHDARVPVGDLRPGTEFRAALKDSPSDVRTWRLRQLTEDSAEAVDSTRTRQPFALDTVVEVVGRRAFDPNDDLGSVWQRIEHPEFAYEDLDDLIRALVEYRKSKEGS